MQYGSSISQENLSILWTFLHSSAAVYDTTFWKWVPNLQAKLGELKLSHFPRLFFSLRVSLPIHGQKSPEHDQLQDR